MTCKENDKTLTDFFRAMEQSLSEKPPTSMSYASRVLQARSVRNPLRSYVASMRVGTQRLAG